MEESFAKVQNFNTRSRTPSIDEQAERTMEIEERKGRRTALKTSGRTRGTTKT